MTTDGHLPQFFGRTNKHGVPYVAVIIVWLFGVLAYLSKFSTRFPDASLVLTFLDKVLDLAEHLKPLPGFRTLAP